MSTDDVRTLILADAGPVAEAVRILATQTTLAEHVTLTEGDPIQVEVTGLPFSYWGTGTQGLWRLLSSIAYVPETVNLYRVAAALDSRNSEAARRALYVLFGGGVA